MPSKTQALINIITSRIRSGEFPPGAKLPSGRELCEQYDVSMMVVRTAVERLRAARLITTAPGSGYYVADPLPPDRPE
jgi:DNA-binding GntR family transcriptional regulator